MCNRLERAFKHVISATQDTVFFCKHESIMVALPQIIAGKGFYEVSLDVVPISSITIFISRLSDGEPGRIAERRGNVTI